MKKKDDIIVWDEFEQVTKKETENQVNEEKFPTFTRNYEVDEPSRTRKITNHIKRLKPFMIAMFSALFIGSVVGFVMLNFLTNVSDHPQDLQQQPVSNQMKIEDANQDVADHAEAQLSYTLKPMHGYVLQVGVFNERDNAEISMASYEAEGLSVVLWQMNEQYFLFAGVAATKTAAEILATELESDEIEIYVKEWETPEYEVEVSEQEYEWLTSFQELWDQSVIDLGTNGSINTEAWQDILDEAQGEYSHIEPFIGELMNKIDDLNNPAIQSALLLEIWQQFISIFNL